VRRCRALILVLLLLPAGLYAQGWSLTDTKGRVHRLADYRGKWVIVNFWATWCPPCLEEIPDLSAAYDAHQGRDLMVIGVAMDYQKAQEAVEFADNMLMSYPLVLGNEAAAAQFGGVGKLPTSFVFNPEGRLIQRQVGALAREAVERYLSGPTRAPAPGAVR
jgi:peroxiredoxin